MTQKTTQLRRYALVDGMYDDFLAWWRGCMPAVRTGMGFTIEFAYGVRRRTSSCGRSACRATRSEFARVEAEYLVSDERAAAFRGQPARIASQDNRIIDFAWQG